MCCIRKVTASKQFPGFVPPQSCFYMVLASLQALDSMTMDPNIPQPDPIDDPVPHTKRSHHRLSELGCVGRQGAIVEIQAHWLRGVSWTFHEIHCHLYFTMQKLFR